MSDTRTRPPRKCDEIVTRSRRPGAASFSADTSGVRHAHERRTDERRTCAGRADEGRSMSPREVDEPVRLTRIYTRGGDGGSTSLGDMSRASKLDPLVRAYGAVDELNSVLGWARVVAEAPELERIQNELFDLGADLSVPYVEGDGKLRVDQSSIDRLEVALRRGQRAARRAAQLHPARRIEAAGRLHIARSHLPPRRARGARRPPRATREPAGARLPEPAQRSALHPRARGQHRRDGATLEARRRALATP